jgi:hypothetical protein
MMTKRAVCVREVIEVLAVGENTEEIVGMVGRGERLRELADKRFMFEVEGIGRKVARDEAVRRMNLFDASPLE